MKNNKIIIIVLKSKLRMNLSVRNIEMYEKLSTKPSVFLTFLTISFRTLFCTYNRIRLMYAINVLKTSLIEYSDVPHSVLRKQVVAKH